MSAKRANDGHSVEHKQVVDVISFSGGLGRWILLGTSLRHTNMSLRKTIVLRTVIGSAPPYSAAGKNNQFSCVCATGIDFAVLPPTRI